MTGASTVTYKAGSVYDSAISSSADVTWSKVQSHFTVTENFGIERTATPAAKDFIVWEGRAAGVIEFVYAGREESGSSTSITVDLRMDNSTILNSPITVLHTTGDHVAVAGVLTTTTFAAGAMFSMTLATSSTTGASGPYATIGAHYTAIPS